MKKLLAIAAFALFSTVASAATLTINCSLIISASVPNGASNSNCPGFGALPGQTINGVSMTYSFDFTFNAQDPGVPQVTYAADAPGTAFDLTGIVANTGNRPVTNTVNGSAADYANLVAPFVINASWTAVTPPVTAVTLDFRFTVDYSAQTGVIPEPSTFVLLGLGLVGTALVARKRNA